MIIFHCFPTDSSDTRIYDEREFFSTDTNTNNAPDGFGLIHPGECADSVDQEIAALLMGVKPFTDNCKQVLRKCGLLFDDATHALRDDEEGAPFSWDDLSRSVRTLLALTSTVENPFPGEQASAQRTFDLPDELYDGGSMRILQALPLDFHFAITADDYIEIANEIRDYIDEWERRYENPISFDEFAFTLIVHGKTTETYRVGQRTETREGDCICLTDLGEDLFHDEE